MNLGFDAISQFPISQVSADNVVTIAVTGNNLVASIGNPNITASGNNLIISSGSVSIVGTASIEAPATAMTLSTGEGGVITWNEIIPGATMVWTPIKPY